MKNKTGFRAVVLSVALMLMVAFCTFPVFATESTGGRDSTLVQQANEGVPNEKEIEINFFNGLRADNGLQNTLFAVGAVLAFAGAVGLVCIIAWRRAYKKRDRTEETREGILNAIELAEQRNKKQATKPKKRAPEKQDEAITAAGQIDIFDTQENDAAEPIRLVREAPIVPSTPVSMQPEKPRVKVQPQMQRVVPQEVHRAEAEPKPAPRVEETKPAKPKYDLDDILNEIREGKL